MVSGTSRSAGKLCPGVNMTCHTSLLDQRRHSADSGSILCGVRTVGCDDQAEPGGHDDLLQDLHPPSDPGLGRQEDEAGV